MINKYLAWRHKYEILITNPPSTEGFQGSITIPYKPGMRADFRDIRFSDINGKPLTHYRESYVIFKTAKFWIKLPAKSIKIYMHYGNGRVLTASNGSTFDFLDEFTSFSTSTWSLLHGTESISSGTLLLNNKTLNSIIQSKTTFGYNTIVEMRAYHSAGNRCLLGFRDENSQKAGCWTGGVVGDSDDFFFTNDGNTGNWDPDGVYRAGSTYYIYGVAYLSTGPKYYVDSNYRGQVTTNLPTGNLPVHFYSEDGGTLRVDWVRVRKYAAVEPVLTLGKKYTTQPKGFPWFETIPVDTGITIETDIGWQDYTSLSTQMGTRASVALRYPIWVSNTTTGPYKRWKYKGDIGVPLNSETAFVAIDIPVYPGMALDGRDLRFADVSQKPLRFQWGGGTKYHVLATSEGKVFATIEGKALITDNFEIISSCLVEVPANTSKINFYYGNGLAIDASTMFDVTGVVTNHGVVERHYPQTSVCFPQYESITPKAFVGMCPGEPVLKERKELRDYSLVSCDVTKSISDNYLQLSANFADDTVPPENSTVKYISRDSSGGSHLLFIGKVVANDPTISYMGKTIKMQAADMSRNLSVQKVPWNCQVITLGNVKSWPDWIITLLDSPKTGVYPGNIVDTMNINTQITVDPKTSRLEAIKKIADYCGLLIHTKIVSSVREEITTYYPVLHAVQAKDVDQPAGGFDLQGPFEFTWPDEHIVDRPEIINSPEEKYNKVIVYGTLSDTGETVVSAAFTPAVANGSEKAREYIIQDNTIAEKDSSVEIEAIKWLLYFAAPRVTVKMQFVNRFDLELYQRVRFGEGFEPKLREITNSTQLPYVIVCDPRDEANSTHAVDVSGVPRPKWLRVSSMKYHSEKNKETCDLEVVTDYIYSSIDEVVSDPYSKYIAPGYMKPLILDQISTTQAIVNETIDSQLSPEICTVLSISADGKTAVVQTASGKLVTVTLTT
jgi:Domain of unknown function (DUF2341).